MYEPADAPRAGVPEALGRGVPDLASKELAVTPPPATMMIAAAAASGRLGGLPGQFAGDTGDTVVPAGAGAQDHPATVQYAGPQVARGAGGVAQLTPPLVQPQERFLDDILSRRPVAEHDVGKADKAQRMRLVQRGHFPGGCLRGHDFHR